MYFGGIDDKCREKPKNVWKEGGRLHHDHATHQIEDYY